MRRTRLTNRGHERSPVIRRGGRLAFIVLALLASLGAHADDLALGDAAWAKRAEGAMDGRPQSAPILEAVAAYERALATEPGSLERRWKLLRALHFAGDIAIEDPAEQRKILDRAKAVSEDGVAGLADRAGAGKPIEEMEPRRVAAALEAAGAAPRDVARFYFWAAINWGAWSQKAGLLSAVRQGVANRIHDYTSLTLVLEPEYDAGGAFRILGRMHAELPRVPFLSGWVDREQAIPLLERAYGFAPADPGNQLLLALTLLDLAPERREEAVALLEQVEVLTPRPSMRIEDWAMRQAAQERLALLGEST